MSVRPALGLGLDIRSETVFYAVVLGWTVLMHLLLARLVRSRFGLALQAVRENEQRMGAIGYSTRQYRLIAFAVAGVMAGVAGALLAMHNQFVSPKLLHWSQSGTLMIMVVLGGMGRLHGGFLGAATLLLLEEVLSGYFSYWHIYVGAILLLVVMVSPDGLVGLGRLFRRKAAAPADAGRAP
jgi:branched-chain amino acid transport system permease protein